MRKLFAAAPVSLLALSCLLHVGRAQAETFTFTAAGYDVNTGISLSVSAVLIGNVDPTASGAYDLTSGGGTVTLSGPGTSPGPQAITLYLPSGTAAASQYAAFSGSPFQYSTNYTYDNVLYPHGTSLNGASGAELDEYGLLFSSADNHFNFFGQGGYEYVDDSILNGFNSPLSSVTLKDVTATNVTPEPSSILLLGTGLLGAAGMLRRRFGA